MSAARCIRLALLLSLIPLALRATSLLVGGHGAPATAPSRHSSWTARHGRSSRTATTVASAAPARGRDRPYRHATHRRRSGTAAASDGGKRRLRQAAGGRDWFEDDKRLAPTGSNPLHNLR